ncbi:hypothetical protein M3Y94_00190300 [Aphelenchoides besseyi]|nr:hypothetical protein M3Y94_00190300 [Aphelenchoides besseyi]KAI6236800.1 hypothetical protein M3Y95_00196900 [Aphelenchoides besseyi]
MDVEMEELIYEDMTDTKPAEEPKVVESSVTETSSTVEDSPAISSPSTDSKRRTITWTNEDAGGLSSEASTSEKESNRHILKPRQTQRSVSPSSFGIEVPIRREQIDAEQIETLYDGLQVDADDEHVRLSAIFVQGLKPISVYELQKIFAEFQPTRCALLSPNTGLIKFGTNYETADALIGCTKLLMRTRKYTAPEEGEINDGTENDGALQFENGEDVTVIRDGSRKRKISTDTVEVDVDEVQIPAGKWRLVTCHVPQDRYLFVRFAVGSEVRQSLVCPHKQEFTENEESTANDETTHKNFKKSTVKPGLNIFNAEGEELNWKYEHDTRFYEQKSDDKDSKVEEEKSKTPTLKSNEEEIITPNGGKIRSRGRGTKRFLVALEE